LERYKRIVQSKKVWISYIFAYLAVFILFYYQWIIGTFLFFLLTVVLFYELKEEKEIQQQQLEYVSNLSYRVDKAGEEVFHHAPLAIIVYNEMFDVEWMNPYAKTLLENKSTSMLSLSHMSEQLVQAIENNEEKTSIIVGESRYDVTLETKHRILFMYDRTKEKLLEQQLHDRELVLAVIYLDNYEEISRNMVDNVKTKLNSEVTSKLNKWANTFNLYIKRTSQDRFIAIMTKKILHELEKTRFAILDEIRETQIEDEPLRNPVTLSIGIGTGNVSIPELAELAESGLDLALGRGGDQITIRDEEGKVRFYGGKTNPMEKRTRVRARVISHALRNLVEDSDNVIIMGHKGPDLDSLGATLGVLNIARSNDVAGYILFEEDDVTTSVQRVIEKVKQDETLWKHFIGREEANAIYTDRSLVVVVDTHRPSLVAYENLIHQAEHVVVIDHHRRGEEFIENPTLVYMEPYASSTSELVTELIEYQPKKTPLNPLEATALLAGIIVDTKSFTLRTGSRTFDAASYLRSKGADPVLIQHFLKEDLESIVKRNELIDRAEIVHDSLAVVVAKDELYETVIIAQAADKLLTVDNVKASFVIAHTSDDMIAISARSLGDINVQIIMESLGGGGHLTNAATQLQSISLEEAEAMLLDKITQYIEGRM